MYFSQRSNLLRHLAPRPASAPSSIPHPAGGPTRRRRAGLAVAGGAILVAALVAAGIGVSQARSAGAPAPCASGTTPLRVAAAPEIADVVTAVARNVSAADRQGCRPTVVVGADPADVANALLHDPLHRPDVWIPDSSVWAARARLPAGAASIGPSIAGSPLVLAVSTQLARLLGAPGRHLDVAALLAAAGGGVPLQWALADPRTSSASAAAVLALRDTAATSGNHGALTRVLRASARTPELDVRAALVPGVAARVVPASEQAVWTADAAGVQLTAVYPASGQRRLDYPYLVLADEHDRRDRARALLRNLQAAPARVLLQAAGFREAGGLPGPALSAARGVNPADGRGASPLVGADVSLAADTLAAIERPSRLLVVLDVSGSMSEPAGRGTASRLDVALAAAMSGLALYPDDTEVGLWEFATHLSPHSDYRQVLPVVPLGRGPDGSLGRDRVAAALQSIHVDPHGDTALYDTALAAVRSLRSTWDATRQNTVVLLTDGRNDDDHGLSLPAVLQRLRAENDPQRPVPLVGLAYGADGDEAALSAMSTVTGGVSYRVNSPEQVRAVLLDAIARRPGTAVR